MAWAQASAYAAVSCGLQPLIRNSEAVENVISDQLRTAQQAGRMPPQLDARAEATSLLATSAGLGTGVLAGQRSTDDALALIRYQLDRLLPRQNPETG